MTVGQITINELVILEVSSDPSISSGQAAPTGSLALLDGGAQVWQKYGSLDTNWSRVTSPIIPQLCWVNKGGNDTTGTVGDFSRPFLTLDAAYTAITDATPSKQYAVIIGAGSFTINNPVAAKPNIFLEGQAGSLRATKIMAANANQHLFTMTDSVYMTNLYFGGVTGSGFYLINITGSTVANGDIRFLNCFFGSTNSILKAVGSNSYQTNVVINNCICGYGGAFTNGFLIDGTTVTYPPTVLMQNFITDYLAATPSYIASVKNGASLRVLAGNFDGRGYPPTTGFQVESGGTLEVSGSRIGNFVTALQTNNTGIAPELNVTGIYLEDNTLDVNILHTSSRGGFNGISARSKIVNNAPNTFVMSYNEEGVGFITSGDLVVKGGYVLDPQITTITLNGTLVLTQFSNKAQVLTGTASGFTLTLPSALLALRGQQYEIYNTTNQPIPIKDGANNVLTTCAQNSLAYCFLVTSGSLAGVWVIWQVLLSSTASGVINYNLTTSTTFVTSSTTDVLVTGFTLTPQAGTYAVWLNAACQYSAASRTFWWSLYQNGSLLSDTPRAYYTGHSVQDCVMSSQSIVHFNGSDTIDLRVRCDPSSGSLTVNNRSLLLIRLGT